MLLVLCFSASSLSMIEIFALHGSSTDAIQGSQEQLVEAFVHLVSYSLAISFRIVYVLSNLRHAFSS